MSLKKKKRKKIWIWILVMVGSFFIIIATAISTVFIPLKESDMQTIQCKIDTIQRIIDNGLQMKISYDIKRNKRQILMHERSVFLINSGDILRDFESYNVDIINKYLSELENDIIEMNLELSALHAILFLEKNGENRLKQVQDSLSNLFSKYNSYEQISPVLEDAFIDCVLLGNKNLQNLQNKKDAFAKDMSKQGRKRETLFKLFSWLQIFGLITLLISSYLDKNYENEEIEG